MAETEAPLFVYYHTHWDREWYMPFRAYQLRLAQVVDEVLERLETGALPCFMLDGQTVVLDDYLELRPQNRPRLEALIREGRLSIGPWFVAPDEFLVSGESLIRNLARGMRTAEAWGCHQFTGYLPDTFGHAADMPMLLSKLGIGSAMVWRGVNPERSLFWWQSPNGNRLPTLHLTEGYFQMALDDWELSEPQRREALLATEARLRAATSPGLPILWPQGADHMGPVPPAGRALLRACFPQAQETTPEKFMAALAPDEDWPVIEGELADNASAFLLPGVYSARLYLKQANRKLEHRLVHQLEPLLAMAQTLLPPARRPAYPAQELDMAWRLLNLNQPHDSICGCSVDAVHRENEGRFDQVTQLADGLQAQAQAALSRVGAPGDWVIFNTGDRPYTGVVPVTLDRHTEAALPAGMQLAHSARILADQYLTDTHRIPLAHLKQTRLQGWIWAGSVPAYGLGIQPQDGLASPPSLAVGPDCLENDRIGVRLAGEGTLVLEDKRRRLSWPGNLVFRIWHDAGDSYNSDPVSEPVQARFESVEVVQSGPLVASLRLVHRFGLESQAMAPEPLVTELCLKAGSPVLEISVRLGRAGSQPHGLQVGFQTAEPVTSVQAEGHFNLVERRYDPAYTLQSQPPASRMREHQTNTGPIQRFVSANGLSWITEGLTEYEVAGSALYFTLRRTFHMLSHETLNTRGAPAGPPLHTPEALLTDRAPETFRLAWLPTPETPADLYDAAARFYGTVWAVAGSGEMRMPGAACAMMAWDNPAVVASACYWQPGEGLFLRLINPTGELQTVGFAPGFSCRECWQTDFREQRTGPASSDRMHFAPRDVGTLCFSV